MCSTGGGGAAAAVGIGQRGACRTLPGGMTGVRGGRELRGTRNSVNSRFLLTRCISYPHGFSDLVVSDRNGVSWYQGGSTLGSREQLLPAMQSESVVTMACDTDIDNDGFTDVLISNDDGLHSFRGALTGPRESGTAIRIRDVDPTSALMSDGGIHPTRFYSLISQ